MKKTISIILATAIMVLSFPLGFFTFTVGALSSGDYTYEISSNNAVITGVNADISGKVTVPEKLDNYTVTEIGDKAFYQCKNIIEVVVPDTVTTIGDGAFAFCENLQKVTLPDGIKAINDGVFSDCVKLTQINIPDTVETIGEIAFCNCEALVSIVIPDGVTSIGGCAFEGCSLLRSISIPDSVVSVGEGVFTDCIGLVDVTIGNGLDAISKQMFYGCKSIVKIIIPAGVETIGNSAFEGCENLATLYLPRSVKMIKSYAFNNCNKLTNVWYTGAEVEKENITIELFNQPLTNATWQYQMYWQIKADNGTGVYNIFPIYKNEEDKPIENFNEESIIVLDKQGKAVKYYAGKDGWPLVKDQIYTVMLNVEYDSAHNIAWQLYKKADTIFPDTFASGWYNDAVTYAVGAGIISGYSNGKFGTSDSIKRQDFLVILARLDGVDLDTYGAKKSAFRDVPEGSYYEAAVNWGSENLIVTGYDSGEFGVGDKVTREQLVTFLYRYAKYKGYDYGYANDRENIVSTQYKDFKKVSSLAKQPILWAIEKGVISGKTATTIVPQGNAQRCEVAKIMYNIFLENIFVKFK